MPYEYPVVLRLLRTADGTIDWQRFKMMLKPEAQAVWQVQTKKTHSPERRLAQREMVGREFALELFKHFGNPESLVKPIEFKELLSNNKLAALMRKKIYRMFIFDGSFSFRMFKKHLPSGWRDKILPPSR